MKPRIAVFRLLGQTTWYSLAVDAVCVRYIILQAGASCIATTLSPAATEIIAS